MQKVSEGLEKCCEIEGLGCSQQEDQEPRSQSNTR